MSKKKARRKKNKTKKTHLPPVQGPTLEQTPSSEDGILLSPLSEEGNLSHPVPSLADLPTKTPEAKAGDCPSEDPFDAAASGKEQTAALPLNREGDILGNGDYPIPGDLQNGPAGPGEQEHAPSGSASIHPFPFLSDPGLLSIHPFSFLSNPSSPLSSVSAGSDEKRAVESVHQEDQKEERQEKGQPGQIEEQQKKDKENHREDAPKADQANQEDTLEKDRANQEEAVPEKDHAHHREGTPEKYRVNQEEDTLVTNSEEQQALEDPSLNGISNAALAGNDQTPGLQEIRESLRILEEMNPDERTESGLAGGKETGGEDQSTLEHPDDIQSESALTETDQKEDVSSLPEGTPELSEPLEVSLSGLKNKGFQESIQSESHSAGMDSSFHLEELPSPVVSNPPSLWKKWIAPALIRLIPVYLGFMGIWTLIELLPRMPKEPFLAGSGVSSYWIVCIAAALGIGLWAGFGPNPKLKHPWLIAIGCLMFALMITLGNYTSWYADGKDRAAAVFTANVFWTWMYAGVTCGFFAFYGMASVLDGLHAHSRGKRKIYPSLIFWVTFLLAAAWMLYVFYQALYPGLWLSDSISQIKQGYENVYSNHHPFAHTMIIKWLMTLGYDWFGTVDGAVATYSVVSILIMALLIAYAVMSLYQIARVFWLPFLAFVMFAGAYYNWFYAVSLLKDTYFAMAVLGFSTAALRILLHTGSGKINNVCLGFFALGVCLFRSNGLMAMLVLAIVCCICLWKSKRTFSLILLGTSLAGYLIIGPGYTALNIESARYAESFSIPIQQIGRVVYMQRPLTEEQQTAIEALMPLKDMAKQYTYWLSDPIKFVLSTEENDAILQENKQTYQDLWLELFQAYPMDYLLAWIGQTMGYWNGDYDYWRVLNTKELNELNMENIIYNKEFHTALYEYATYMQKDFGAPVGIGLHTWITLALGIYILCERKNTWPIPLLILLTMGTLVVASPVYSEFRYAYFMFLAMPVLWAAAILPDSLPRKKDAAASKKPASASISHR